MKEDERVAEFDEVRCVHATDAAILCLIDDEEVWLPRSQVHEHSDVREKGDQGLLIVSYWIAESRGLLKRES